MLTIVGLGNPGIEYKETRHNIGWMVLSGVIDKRVLPTPVQSSRFSGLLSEGVMDGVDVAVLFPTVYMNNSGVSVARYLEERGSNDALVVVHDDVDIPFGDVKVSYDRGAGGHNGVKSIIDACGFKSFIRIRIGIAQKGFWGIVKRPIGEKLSAFVLSRFTKQEEKQMPALIEKVDAVLVHILKEGVAYAMQENNKK